MEEKVTREELRKIYVGLANYEKSEWAKKAEYSSYQGLYRYLHNSTKKFADSWAIDALICIIGQERYDNLLPEIRRKPPGNLMKIVSQLKNEILDQPMPEDLAECKKIKETLDQVLSLFLHKIEVKAAAAALKANP